MFWMVSSKELTAFVLICMCLDIGFFNMAMYQPTTWHRFASFWPQKNVIVLYHLPYLLDLALADHFLFPKLKLQWKGRRFEDIQTIWKNMTDVKSDSDWVIHIFWSKFEPKSCICETYISFRLWDTIFRQSENILHWREKN